MTRTITYNLMAEGKNSDSYYYDLNRFAQDWFQKTLPVTKDLIEGFSEWRRKQGLPARAPMSCAYDLLVIGVLLREHGEEAISLPKTGCVMLRRLTSLQERFPKAEGIFKWPRGFLCHILSRLPKKKHPSRTPVEALTSWLTASGDDTQAKRLIEWVDYFHTHGCEESIVKKLDELAEDFNLTSEEQLGKYTVNVNAFLGGEARKHSWRYDAVLIQKTRLEYHMAMLGNVILNLVNREAFLQTKNNIVILPPCMRALQETQCKAEMTENGQRCAGCTASCRIHEVTKLGEKHGFGVYIIPEEIRGYARDKDGEKVGLVGVSCVLTNWGGGWDAERLEIPAQGVLLDYVGCKYHWDQEGFPTDLNLNQLLTCLNLKQAG